ncbi:MAG: glycoside hydrolase family 88/105 protein [Telluria sp.]
MTRRLCLKLALAGMAGLGAGCSTPGNASRAAAGITRARVLDALARANDYWQALTPPRQWAFWDVAAYHTGNMAAYRLTGNPAWRDYSATWAEHNAWRGANSDVSANWKYNYGETNDHVLFGDWQICFQTYIDLYQLDPVKDPRKIARARAVIDYQMATPRNDYWWWADGLFMVMPVMTRLYQVTGNRQYLDKLLAYFSYADTLMFDFEAGLYFRDAKYVYPKHQTRQGKKDFWARGDGWVFAALATTLPVVPKDHPAHALLLARFQRMAAALAPAQQPDGYWTRSLLDVQQAPGAEASGTAFFTFGYLAGMNHGYLDRAAFTPVALRGWAFLADTALQPDGRLGYVQPIGERAVPGQVVDRRSSTPFGVGAFLLAATEMARFLEH